MPAFIFAFLIIIFSFLFQATAQTQTAIERAQGDYNFQFTKYRDTQDEYTKTKAAYLSFKTAVSKNDAYIAAKDYLIQIDQLYLVFLALVEEHGNALNFTKSSIPKDEVNNNIIAEKTYLLEHKQKAQNTKTLEEIPPLSDELETHVKEVLEKKLNKILATYQVVEAETTIEEFTSLSRILDRIVLFKIRAGETKSILANWSTEVKDIQHKTTDKINAAKNELSNKKEATIEKRDLEKITDLSTEAQDELKRSKPLFEELIRII